MESAGNGRDWLSENAHPMTPDYGRVLGADIQLISNQGGGWLPTGGGLELEVSKVVENEMAPRGVKGVQNQVISDQPAISHS